ncbi:iron chelate uptake ABC transporter family permease subunit [Zunongwangia sp.]|uniref:iron chelate uptake ABC transporter family permease subunit n=1 Tax=Zunongwangia sp. TaxID=1965325 RepID=UPI003AA9709F
MQYFRKYVYLLAIFTILLLGLLLLNISIGSVHIPFRDIFSALLNNETGIDTHTYIILEYRLPKAITAIIVGSGLAISGLLMQTLFQNPLAGPYVLGLSSGASLGVSLLIMGLGLIAGDFSDIIFSQWSLVIAASTGSLLVMLCVILASIRLRDIMSILIIGLMFASLTGAVVNILTYFSETSQLQHYIFWSFGSLGDLSWEQFEILMLFWVIGIILSILSIKNLNSLLLGEEYANSLGVNIKQNRLLVILATSLLAGSITAFCGPIAFIGLAVPHLIRQLVSITNHVILLPLVALGGAILMLICDMITNLPILQTPLPINAITSLVGAPVIIWLLIKKQKFLF